VYCATTCRSRRTFTAAICRLLLAALLFLTIAALFLVRNVIPGVIYPKLQATIEGIPRGMLALYREDPKKILKSAIPLLEWSDFEENTTSRPAPGFFWDSLGSMVGVQLQSPLEILQSQIPHLITAETTGPDLPVDQPQKGFLPNAVPAPETTTTLTGECLVGIYNTHTGETYNRTDGLDRLEGKRGGVVTVAEALGGALEERYGIRVVRSDRIHDANYNTSYLESEKTLREMVDGHPGLKAVLDIHRDSGKTREQSLVLIDGQAAAPILIIVGSDARRPFLNWRQNYNFAVRLSDSINEMYPGLSLGVRVKDGLYNQFLHPRAILLEMGTTENSTEEAACSARFLADVLAELLAGEAAPAEESSDEAD
jgi:stage II sporulation protein P